MSNKPSQASDLRGLIAVTVDAIVGITDMAEVVHMNVLHNVAKFGVPGRKPIAGITALVYRSVRGTARLFGTGIDALLARLAPLLGKGSAWPGREAVRSILGGVLGDYLAARNNPLSIAMEFRCKGKVLVLEKQALAAAIPNAKGRILVLVHGLCMNDLQWHRDGHDHGESLERDRAYTAVYLHYNTGRHISTNGREFSEQLETLIRQWPLAVEELVILGHSMGGLVTRSAFHYGAAAGHQWPTPLTKLVFLGTPHHGAPLERGGNWFHVIANVSAYTAPFSNLGKIRSAGITDLRYGNLLDEDWEGQDRFAHVGDQRHAVPLPAKVQCFTIAASTGKKAGDISGRLLGDGLVPLDSALGRHDDPSLMLAFAPENQAIEYELNHLDLLSRDEVYRHLLDWL